jgi:predicted amidohydrolase
VLTDGGEEPGYVTAEIDLAEAGEARAMIPAWGDARTFSLTVAGRLDKAS